MVQSCCFRRRRWCVGLLLLIVSNAGAGDLTEITTAARNGLGRVRQAGVNWQQNQTCFSCHHQTLPVFALRCGQDAGLTVAGDWFTTQDAFAEAFFTRRIERLEAGEHIGGGAFTVSYGLWAAALDRQPASPATNALVENLLKIQQPAGHWKVTCRRPPLQESPIALTILCIHGLRLYATPTQQERADAAIRSADGWLDQQPSASNEDRAWRLWRCGQRHDADGCAAAKDALRKTQHDDGGWGQIDGMSSDAYATGQSLFMLLETDVPASDSMCQRAADWLVRTQFEDGSWRVVTRVKPVQTYFENGDPHAVDQFLSVAATAWGAAGLCRMLPTPQRTGLFGPTVASSPYGKERP